MLRCCVSLTIAALLMVGGAQAATVRLVNGVQASALAQAARRTPVKAIDYDEDRCDQRSVEQWLVALAGPEGRDILWEGGPCQLVGPGIDSGSRWCAQATVELAHPRSRDDQPMIEIYFEAPVKGRPGKAYAFRGLFQTPDGGDITRFRKDFEADWASRFAPPEGAVTDCGAD